MNIRTFIKTAMVLAIAPLCLSTQAQAPAAVPGSPVRILVGFPPGGTIDVLARLLAERLNTSLGRTVIVESKPGANGRVATETLAASREGTDVYLIAPVSTIVFPALTQPDAQRIDIFKDIRPVAALASVTLGVAVNSKTPTKDAKSFVAWVKENPSNAQYGIPGVGGQNHFLGFELGRVIGARLNAVGYRGNAPLITDLLAGHVPMAVLPVAEVASYVSSGRMQIVGVLTEKRTTLMPEVPTFAEQGVPVTAGEAWYGMWAPANARKADTDRMQAALEQALAQPALRAHLEGKLFMGADFRSGEQAGRRMHSEYDFWQPIVKASGFKPE